MLFKNYKLRKYISTLIIIFVLVPTVLFSRPQKTYAIAGWVADFFAPIISGSTGSSAASNATTAATGIKALAKTVVQEVLKGLARNLLQKMTTSTINWINSGFHGSPLFVQNPQSFFKDIAKYEVKSFVDTIGYDSLRFPFGKNLALNTIATYKTQFADNAQYSLSKVTSDQGYVNSFRNDFSVGGWNGFLLNTQYPQNNPIGFQMLATDELARRLEGTEDNAAQTVQKTLQQGAGYLSPQTCPGNAQYNNLQNQWDKPEYKPIPYPDDLNIAGDIATMGGETEGQTALSPNGETFYYTDAGYMDSASFAKYQTWETQNNDAQATWAKTNDCPGGLKDTTPGSTVGAAINKALGGSQDQTTMAAALGNSVSAILDSLLNHFINKGLSSLATTKNPAPQTADTWDYLGNTLGTADAANDDSWDSGPDDVIVLSDFKQAVDDSISQTTEEIDLMNQEQATFTAIWQTTKDLDQCVPGPDLGWQDRLTKEENRNSLKFGQKASDDDPVVAAAGLLANNELEYAVNLFQDWINNHMIDTTESLALPDSVNYLDQVNSIESTQQQATELVNSKRIKIDALARLKSIQANLVAFTSEPVPGSPEETSLINYRKQYDATQDSASNPSSVENTRNDLNTAIDKSNAISNSVTQCLTERTAKGWGPVDTTGDGDSKLNNGNSEKEEFCSLPIVGGEPHGPFLTPVTSFNFGNKPNYTPTYVNQNLPLVNAGQVEYGDERNWGLTVITLGFGGGVNRADINVSCDAVFKSTLVNYKGTIPGATTTTDSVGPGTYGNSNPYPGNTDTSSSSGGGKCSSGVGNDSGAPSTINESQIVWDDADIGNWAVTANLSGVSTGQDQINLNFDKANSWPSILLSSADNAPVVGNAWVIVWRDGAWHASTFDWLRPGQTSKNFDNIGGADGTLAAPLGNFSPKIGETYGFVVSTPARGGNSGPVNERSNIVTFTWNINACTATNNGGTSSSSSPIPTPTPPPTTAGTPGITSISPTTVVGGQTTLTINGTNLTSTVQFFDSVGARTTVVGTVNSAKTQTKVLVPAGLLIGSGSVKVYANASSVSNTAFLNISASGTTSSTGGPATTAVTSSWTPPQTINGWWSQLSPDGNFVAYGNWGESWVTNLTTKQNYDFSNPADLAGINHSCIGGQWITSTKISFICYADSLPKDSAYRYEVSFSNGVPGAAVRTSDDPALVAGNQFKMADGHWASWSSAGFRLVRDNKIIGTSGGGLGISGTQTVAACDNSNTSVCLWSNNSLSKTYTAKVPLFDATINNGYILYGGYGPVNGINPAGTDTPQRLSPNYNEGVGKVFFLNGAAWVATPAYSDAGVFIFLRPWGSKTAIAISAEAINVSVAVVGSNFEISYYSDKGKMYVITVPTNSPRVVIP